MPYLIQYGCLTMDSMGQFHNTESRRSNNLKFLKIIQEKGSSGLNLFLEALDHFTREEPGEGSHRELLNSLQSGIKRLNYKRKMSVSSKTSTTSFTSDPFSSISTCGPIPKQNTTHTQADDVDIHAPEINPSEVSIYHMVVDIPKGNFTMLNISKCFIALNMGTGRRHLSFSRGRAQAKTRRRTKRTNRACCFITT